MVVSENISWKTIILEQRPKTYKAFNYYISSKKMMSENIPGPKTYGKYGNNKSNNNNTVNSKAL